MKLKLRLRRAIGDIAFREINQEFESQRFQQHQPSRWADQAQRDKIRLYGELEKRNRLFQEDHARDCQEIEDLRRICCEEVNWARQVKNDEWVNWWLKYGMYRTKYIPCPMQENSMILNQGAALERPTFRIQLLRFWVPGPCHGAILDCCEIHRIVRVLWETFLNDHLLKKDYPLQSSTIQRISHVPLRDWDLIPPIQQGKERMEWKGNRWIRRLNHLTSKAAVECYPILVELNFTMVWLIIQELLLRNWILEKMFDPMEFQSWKTNFRAEVCLKTADPQVTMLSIKEVEIAKPMDELMTSRSIVEKDFPDEEDSQHACTLPKKSKCQRAACSKTRLILTRKTNCVHGLRVFPCNRSLWSSTRNRRLVHYEFAEWATSKISMYYGVMQY